MSTPNQVNLALIVSENPFSRTIKDRGVPTPGQGELLVRIEASGINPVDAVIGQMYIPMWPDLPTVLGGEASGVVVAMGEGVEGFEIGDRVVYTGSCQKADVGSFQQFGLANSTIVGKLPPNVSAEEGASIPVGFSTSYHALYAQPPHGAGLLSPLSPGGRGKYAGRPIVILGGSGATGHYAIQWARLSGFSPIITTASLKHEAYLKSLGATHIVDRTLPDAEVIAGIISSALAISLVFDAVSTTETIKLGFEVLKQSNEEGKTLLHIMPTECIPESEAQSAGIHLYMGWSSSVWPQYNALSRELYGKLEGLLLVGDIKPLRIEIVRGGLHALEEALQGADKVSGVKRVVLPGETRMG